MKSKICHEEQGPETVSPQEQDIASPSVQQSEHSKEDGDQVEGLVENLDSQTDHIKEIQ